MELSFILMTLIFPVCFYPVVIHLFQVFARAKDLEIMDMPEVRFQLEVSMVETEIWEGQSRSLKES